VTHIFFPSDCRLCGAAMVFLGKVRVCEVCLGRVGPEAQAERDTLCSRCGDALGMESARFAAAMGVTECTMCRLAPPRFAKAVAFANYDNEMREALHLLKFQRLRPMAEHVLGERLAAAVLRLEPVAAREAVVVPVPLFAARERERGFNQATLLAEASLRRLRRLRPEWRLRLQPGAIERVRDTRALYRLSPRQRRSALRGAFRVAQPEAVRGREVLLVDDIMTTGATANECSRVLLRAGAAKVWVATVAKAQPESVRSVAEGVAPGDWAAGGDGVNRVIGPDAGRRVSF
jgi:ComF family protein